MKKNILFVMHFPPPVGGQAVVGSFIKNSKIINNTFNCDYINLSTSTSIEDIGKNSFKKYITLLKISLNVAKLLIKNKYDCCYVTPAVRIPAFYKDFFVILILKIFGVKILYHLHNRGVSECDSKPINQSIYKFSFKNTKVILLSDLLYPDIASYIRIRDVYICPNGIPFINAARHLLKRDNKKCQLLFLSNMQFEKGILVLLDACKILKDKNVDFECNFVGHWADISENDFVTRVKDLGLAEYVYTHGKKYNDEKTQFFLSADIFVFPTYFKNETFGLVNLEAMQFALPIVSTIIGGIPDVIIDNETGYLVEPGDAISLANKIKILIEDSSLRVSMGLAGKKRFEERFTIEIFEKRMLEILNQEVINS